MHVLNSRKAFTNVCIGLKSRAAMLGKRNYLRNYLPGPNVLTSWCIVLAGLAETRNGGSQRLSNELHGGWIVGEERILMTQPGIS